MSMLQHPPPHRRHSHGGSSTPLVDETPLTTLASLLSAATTAKSRTTAMMTPSHHPPTIEDDSSLTITMQPRKSVTFASLKKRVSFASLADLPDADYLELPDADYPRILPPPQGLSHYDSPDYDESTDKEATTSLSASNHSKNSLRSSHSDTLQDPRKVLPAHEAYRLSASLTLPTKKAPSQKKSAQDVSKEIADTNNPAQQPSHRSNELSNGYSLSASQKSQRNGGGNGRSQSPSIREIISQSSQGVPQENTDSPQEAPQENYDPANGKPLVHPNNEKPMMFCQEVHQEPHGYTYDDFINQPRPRSRSKERKSYELSPQEVQRRAQSKQRKAKSRSKKKLSQDVSKEDANASDPTLLRSYRSKERSNSNQRSASQSLQRNGRGNSRSQSPGIKKITSRSSFGVPQENSAYAVSTGLSQEVPQENYAPAKGKLLLRPNSTQHIYSPQEVPQENYDHSEQHMYSSQTVPQENYAYATDHSNQGMYLSQGVPHENYAYTNDLSKQRRRQSNEHRDKSPSQMKSSQNMPEEDSYTNDSTEQRRNRHKESGRYHSSSQSDKRHTKDTKDSDSKHHNYDSKGRCIHHPHNQLRKKKLFGVIGSWKILMMDCPDCCLDELRRDMRDMATAITSHEPMPNLDTISTNSKQTDREMTSSLIVDFPLTSSTSSRRPVDGRHSVSTASMTLSSDSISSGSAGYRSCHSNQFSRCDTVAKSATISGDISSSLNSGDSMSANSSGRFGKDPRAMHNNLPAVVDQTNELSPVHQSRPASVTPSARRSVSTKSSREGKKEKKKKTKKQLMLVRDMDYTDVNGNHGHYSGRVDGDFYPHGHGVMVYQDGTQVGGEWTTGRQEQRNPEEQEDIGQSPPDEYLPRPKSSAESKRLRDWKRSKRRERSVSAGANQNGHLQATRRSNSVTK